MKKLIIFISLFLSGIANAQVANFEDDFSDQDLSNWSGSIEDFQFVNEGENILLHQVAAGAGTSYLSIPSSKAEGFWEFFIRLDGFNPSNGNRTEIYLMSDSQDLTSNLNGYKLRGGENGSNDVFRLFRVTNGTETSEILTGITDISSGGDFRVKVTRNSAGDWTLEVGEGYAGVLSTEDTGNDDTYTSTSYFGFKNIYTSSRSDAFFYDFKIDIPDIEVNSVSTNSNTEIDITFSRDIDFSSAQASDFTLSSGNINPQTIVQLSSNVTRITFANPIASGQNLLTISSIEDIANQTTLADTSFSFFIYDEYQKGDIVINEFLKDPPTGISEYIELRNTSDRYLNLQQWELGDNNSLSTLSFSNFPLFPDSFVVVSSDTSALNTFYGEAYYLQVSLPAFNNREDQIRLFDASGSLIDSLQYDSEWGGEDVAIERRNPTVSSIFRENWGDSPSTDFGTPGFSNLIQPDTTPPDIESISFISENAIQLIFSELILSKPATTLSNFQLTAEVPFGGVLPFLQSAIFSAPDTVLLLYNTGFESDLDGTTYELSVFNQSDIFENNASDINRSFFRIDYAQPDSGEVSINEFVYDPPESLTEFVEIINRTDSAFNLQDWTLNDNTGNRRTLSDTAFTLKPNDYLILTSDSSLMENFPQTKLLALGSRYPSLNNSTDAIVLRDSEGELIDSLTYTSAWGGDNISLERRSLNFTPAFRENWGPSPSENFATPGLPNLIPKDETAPEIKELSVLDDQTLEIIFTERIQPGPATDPDNYDLLIAVNSEIKWQLPDFIIYQAPDTVLFSYSEKIPRENTGTNYQFIIKNQTDIFGNIASELQAQFFLIDISTARQHSVVINEFMYEPEDTFTEFIELYNPTDKNYDLKGWTLNDNTGNRKVISDHNLELVANSYLLIAPDSSFLTLFPNRPIEIIGSRFSSLNNSTDAIVIRNSAGTLIDSLTYFSEWGGEGVSLERRSPDFPSIYRENWGESPSENLATPGRNNEIENDDEAPVLENASIAAADSIRLIFNERIDSVWAVNTENYTTTAVSLVHQIANYTGSKLTLVLDTPLTSGTIFSVLIGTQRDIFGNISEPDSVELEYLVFSPARDGNVIINEILYRRENAESEEFIELFNRTSENYDLSGWTFSDATGSATIPEGTIIRNDSYLILTDSKNSDDAKSLEKQVNGNRVYLPGFPSLNDDEDAVVIKDAGGYLIDSLFYNETWGGNQPGVSLERKDPESASNDANNWATSTSPTGTSAGAKSSVYEPDQTPPEILFSKIREDRKIYVAFSEFIKASTTGPIKVNEIPTAIFEYKEQNGNVLILGEDSFPEGEPIYVEFSVVTDFRGNSAQSLSIEASQPLSPGDIIINEILFDPLANSDDNLPDQTEYIELYNRSEYAVSLEGFFIHDEPDENNEVRTIEPVFSQFKWIPAGETVVFYAEDQTSDFDESRLAGYFELQDSNEQFFIRTDRANLSLASSDDAVYLADSAGVTIDSVFFDESWHNPNLYDTKGVSLERIDPNGSSNDNSNWSSSTQVSGGTPGAQNSIFQQAGAGPDETGITFTPNPFSPDDDGFEDNLFINYKLEEPDYLLRVRIFDRYGREVRELADGKQAGFEGSLIWDGLKDDQTKNRVGIYIVLFEAYNSAIGRNRTFKKTVVLAKKFK